MDEDHLGYRDGDGATRPRTLISLLGPVPAAQEAAVLAVAAKVAASGRRPVLCGSGLSLGVLVDGTFAVELLPRRSDLAVLSDAEYAAYLRRRWDILLAKWQITEEICLGQDFAGFLSAQTTLAAP